MLPVIVRLGRHRFVGSRVAPWSCALLALTVVLVAVVSAGAASPASTVKVFFGQGEQLVPVTRPGATVQDALTALVAGPTSTEKAHSFRSYVPPGTRVRSVTLDGAVATVDLGVGFLQGPAPDTTLARLDQVVSTTTAVPGVTSVLVKINGGTPLGLFPGVDATVPLTRASLAAPNVPAATPLPAPSGPASAATLALQQQLAALGYLDPAGVDGVAGPGTQTAVMAFQKWQGLPRTGIADGRTLDVLSTAERPAPITRGVAGRRLEILVDRQLVLAIQDNEVVRTIHVSTGKPSTPTPIGVFKVYAKIPRWWSVPFREWLLWASPFTGGVATHQYPDVPPFAASHGCVRVTQYDAPWLYGFLSVGTPVRVLASSR
jgi:lipoprotein-anchoring transpeptidase ErfK/SrfK